MRSEASDKKETTAPTETKAATENATKTKEAVGSGPVTEDGGKSATVTKTTVVEENKNNVDDVPKVEVNEVRFFFFSKSINDVMTDYGDDEIHDGTDEVDD